MAERHETTSDRRPRRAADRPDRIEVIGMLAETGLTCEFDLEGLIERLSGTGRER